MKDMLDGWISIETTKFALDENKRQAEELLNDDVLCGIVVNAEESDDKEDEEGVDAMKEPFTDEDIYRMTEQIKCYATYLQTRDCNGAFDKDAIALMDASTSILQTNWKLKEKRITRKQNSGHQTSIIPFFGSKKVS